MALSNASEPLGELDSLTQEIFAVLEKIQGLTDQNPAPFVTAESVVQSNETISLVKSPICIPCSQKQRSSKTSVPASTTKGKVLEPYWNELCAEISSRLLLPVETDLPDLGLNSLSTWLEVTVRVVQPL
ncbi:hypothetical protein BJP34_07210 [Moorena producens PAL-8-15-08-1]|uniref:Uncharacterized protein n=1 Tax=Moorena producens PAL-8-15-08-1 TaxID=1458985 RepID=A0A1D8TNV3_9CYAN|nr:hypothetical protein BJP34_07210 [Moorena producens PAL-8-15-08-1]